MKYKEFKLRDNMEHTQDGQSVAPGDVVMLTEAQARAFRDKFVPTGDDDFKEEKEPPVYEPGDEAKAKTRGKSAEEPETGPTEEAPQGQPVPQPPVFVEQVPPEGPADPHAMEPARQGQQSREQRKIIDSGNAPMAAIFSEKEPEPAAKPKTSAESPLAGPHVATASGTATAAKK